jgi:uncharacterized protein (TIGR03083 family)
VSSKLTPVIDAWEQTARSVTDLCATLLDVDWNRATGVPGWSVRDCVSHIIGCERVMLGESPPWHQLPRDLVHVRTERQRYMEVPVDIRRCHTPPEMNAELREVVDRRVAMLRKDERGPDEQVEDLAGARGPYLRVLSTRVFDTWAHEQDIRRAVESPGNLDGLAADLSRDLICAALPRVVAKDAGTPPGSSVVFDVSGPTPFIRAVGVGEDGRGALLAEAPATPTVALGMDWETFVRLACGRVRAETVGVKVEGNEELARRILAAMAITP